MGTELKMRTRVTMGPRVKSEAKRIRAIVTRIQFDEAREQLDKFWHLGARLSRKRDGIDPYRLREALLERLDFWWRDRG